MSRAYELANGSRSALLNAYLDILSTVHVRVMPAHQLIARCIQPGTNVVTTRVDHL